MEMGSVPISAVQLSTRSRSGTTRENDESRNLNRARSPRFAAILISLSACGSGEKSGPVDCAWLQGQNCWKSVVAAVVACRPPAGAQGAFSADRKSCAYASGPIASFPAPVANPPEPPYNFSIGTCVTVANPDSTTVQVSSSAGVARIRYLAQSREVTCPDGSVHTADLGPQSPLIGCNGAEALLPDIGMTSREGPNNTSSFYFRGAATTATIVWACY